MWTKIKNSSSANISQFINIRNELWIWLTSSYCTEDSESIFSISWWSCSLFVMNATMDWICMMSSALCSCMSCCATGLPIKQDWVSLSSCKEYQWPPKMWCHVVYLMLWRTEAASSSETLMIYWTTWKHVPRDHRLTVRSMASLASHWDPPPPNLFPTNTDFRIYGILPMWLMIITRVQYHIWVHHWIDLQIFTWAGS
jgi:hypothetical protein